MIGRLTINLQKWYLLKQIKPIYHFSKESEWDQKDFYQKTQLQIDSIGDQIENGLWADKIEIDITEGVLKILTPSNKTFVINRQVLFCPQYTYFRRLIDKYGTLPPGPCRFNYEKGEWVNTRGEILEKLVQNELEILMK